MNHLVYQAFGLELLKLAENAKSRERKKRVLRKIDSARPYAHRGVIGAIPGGMLASFGAKNPGRKHHLAGAAIGGAVAAGDKYLEELSTHRGYKGVLKNYRESAEKTAVDIGVDLRRNGLAKIKRPAFSPPSTLTAAKSSLKTDQSAFRFNAGRSGVPTPPSNAQATTVPLPNPGFR